MVDGKIKLIEKNCCTGCMACANACPKNAIKMVADAEGFLFPEINHDDCIGCGMCNRVCPARASLTEKNTPIESYAAINIDKEVLKKSTSGGVFSALADIIREKNGYVVGCVFNEDLKAVHQIVSSNEKYDDIRGSKYVQSYIGTTYKAVKELLVSGELVLFSGTACQVAGLYSFLGKKYENLYTCDIICHGVSSPKLWELHKKYLEGKNKSLTNFLFRDKSKEGWGLYYYYYYYYKMLPKVKLHKTGTCYEDEYFISFLQGLNYRECCYQCEYAKVNRPADFTLGDFWGVEKYLPNVSTKEGISAVIINTEKGGVLRDKLAAKLKLLPIEIDWIISGNKNLREPTERPSIRDTYYADIDKLGYAKLQKNHKHTKTYIRAKVTSLIPIGIKEMLRKVKHRLRH